ncbi:MAG: excinuclease ABC subunit UvrC [bacterium]|nr:excinuclease ABC subunit UvrC [bacterium]
MITREDIRRLPAGPGVYIVKTAAGEVLYVGKALDIRRRVAAHFRRRGGAFAAAFAPRAEAVEFIVTGTEREALLLEGTLIRERRPRFNIRLEGAGARAYIRLTVHEPWPRLEVAREPRRDGARYFGPYLSASAALRMARFLQRTFPLRDCPLAEARRRTRPCLKHQIGRCPAPCRGLISGRAYRERVRRAALFLSGRAGKLLDGLRAEMERHAAALRYERAGRIRDAIAAIGGALERQRCVLPDGADRDAVGIHREGGRGAAAVLCVRGGRLIGSAASRWEGEAAADGAVVREVLLRHYPGGASVPPEVLVPAMPEDREAVERLLSEARGGRARLVVPRRGARRDLVRMAAANAEAVHRSRPAEGEEAALEAIRARFRLPRLPRRIECVDVSHTGGAAAAGAVVAFLDAAPRPDGYRRFRIRGSAAADDCRMIHEVLSRRFREGHREWGVPDFLVVDGGRGQLAAAERAVAGAGVQGVSVIAVAKEREAGGRKVPDRVYRSGRANPVPLRPGDPASLLLARVRDEAHRFAVRSHRRMRGKALRGSALDGIPGIGPRRKARLLAAFGSVSGIRSAPLDAVEGALSSAAAARAVKARLREGGRPRR